jgi:hypothetical protein
VDADRVAGRIALRVEPRIHLRQESRIDCRARRSDGNRYEGLLLYGLAPGLDAALVVALAGPTETGFWRDVEIQ